MQTMTAEEAISQINSGHSVFIQSAAAAPQQLIRAMTARAKELHNVKIYHLHTEGEAPYTNREFHESFHTYSLFAGANVRRAIAHGEADYIPVFLSEVPSLFRKKIIPLDIALIHVSVPDKHGFCSLGTSVDTTRAAVEMASIVIAQINPNMPRTHGDSLIHTRDINFAVEVTDALPEREQCKITPELEAIGTAVASLIENGATIQTGIGRIPDAVLAALQCHKDLGIHTEMFSDGVIDLIERGVVTGEKKRVHPGKVVSSFVVGTKRLYDFIDDNPLVAMLDVSYVNDTTVIRRNPKVTAINSAIEIDLTGQVCSDSIGPAIYSGVGGQMDFIRGASLSEDGKPIIALPSITSEGQSRIVTELKQGAGVVTTRANVHYIVTEYGIAYLHGKSLRDRTKALIAISHPMHRENLERQARDLLKTL
ncbi:MAG TPA: acetyl-CoA hydrolase/transferase C-terminal domain-containing protein [Candidatus Kapabacteria bacterium]|nr:acetyl-CoA hydrolase/transferase C-terminal domain-containing protein [Candidatus Kapabacteria bacterium]